MSHDTTCGPNCSICFLAVGTRPQVAYVSGPMRSLPGFNFETFHRAADDLRKRGFTVLNPAENFGGDTTLTWEEYMAEDIGQVLNADFVVVLPGWENSVGVKVELVVAASTGKPVYDYGHYLVCFDEAAVPTPLDLTWLLVPAGKREGQPTKRNDQESVLQTANRIVFGKRQSDYGHPHADMKKTAAFWSVLFGIPVKPYQVPMAMWLLKTSRLMETPDHYDSIVDGPGYFGVYDMTIEKMKELGEYK